jgi:hypothetical protein
VTRLKVAFISPVFLFPADAGGKIRTGNILRGLKESGLFDITLLSPATAVQQHEWQGELDRQCERFVGWQPSPPRPRWQRAPDLLSSLPVNVAADRTPAAVAAVEQALAAERFDVVVFDFVHAAVLRPEKLNGATVCFTHNVEAEIFERHAKTAASAPLRWLWASQAAKMRRLKFIDSSSANSMNITASHPICAMAGQSATDGRAGVPHLLTVDWGRNRAADGPGQRASA